MCHEIWGILGWRGETVRVLQPADPAHNVTQCLHQDDCCQRRCTSERQCGPGEGPCLSSSECLTGGSYYICSDTCVDRSHYPLDMYPALAQIYGYASGCLIHGSKASSEQSEHVSCVPGDLCCRRRCTPLTKCGHDTYGCQTDEVGLSLRAIKKI